MRIDDMTWMAIRVTVVEAVCEKPERFADVIRDLQSGVVERLDREQHKVSALDAALYSSTLQDKKRTKRLFEKFPWILEWYLRTHGGENGSVWGQELTKRFEDGEFDVDLDQIDDSRKLK